MARKPRIPKSPARRLAECESHLYFLSDARRLYEQEEDRFKQVAAELRVLVGDHRPERRLLCAMMSEYGFAFAVQPPGPPFERQPIPTVGWRDDPQHQALTEEVAAALGDEAKLAQVLKKQAALRRPMPFDEYVDRALAVYIAPHDYSYRDLVLAVAQQLGSSHEDTAIDVPLAQMESVRICGDLGYVAPLIKLADLVLTIGSLFIAHVVKQDGYEPKYFTTKAV